MMFFSRNDRRATRSSSPKLTHRLQLETLEDRCLLSAGDLDPSFGAGGLVSTSFGRGTLDEGHSVAVQTDGKVIAVGRADGKFGLARYRVDGTLDSTFGSGGKVTTNMGSEAGASDVGIYPNSGTANDGKIVVAGTAGLGGFNNHGFGLVRYNRDGSLDKTFNKTGKVTLDFSIGWDEARAVVIQPDGKIIAAGYSSLPLPSLPDYCCLNSAFTLVRFTVNGTLDTTFGNGGKVITDVQVSEGSELIWDVALQTDGKIVAAGKANPGPVNGCTCFGNYSFALTRYTTNGSLDVSFGNGGIVLNPTGTGTLDEAHAVMIQPDGRIIAAGSMQPPPDYVWQFGVMRFDTNGSLDSTFGTGGVALGGAGTGEILAAALQPDGKIVAAGGTNHSSSQFSLARFNTDGSLDVSFGIGGKVITDTVSNYDQFWGVALQADGKIVAAGETHVGSGSDYDFAVARYLGDSTAVAAATGVRHLSPTVTGRHARAINSIVTILSHEDARRHAARTEAADHAIASLLGIATRRRFAPSRLLDLDTDLLADIAAAP